MNLSRRQFSKSIIAGTLASGLSSLSGLTDLFAQSAKPTQKPIDKAILVGVEHGPIVSNSGAHLNPHSNAIEDYKTLPPSNTPVSALQGLSLQHLHVDTLISKRTVITEPLLSPSDRISGVTYLADGSLLVVINPDAGSANGAHQSRLLTINENKVSGVVSVSNLGKDQSLDSLCLLRNEKLIGMVTKKDGTGPAQVVQVNRANATGNVTVTNLLSLPANLRFSALAEALNGTIYTSVFRNNGTTELWTLDLKKNSSEKVIDLTTLSGCSSKTCTNVPEVTAWYHGLQSLIVTQAGQLLAHGNLEYFLPNSLYAINLGTGFMAEIDNYPVARVALSKQAG
jgi:hypothetical protein